MIQSKSEISIRRSLIKFESPARKICHVSPSRLWCPAFHLPPPWSSSAGVSELGHCIQPVITTIFLDLGSSSLDKSSGVKTDSFDEYNLAWSSPEMSANPHVEVQSLLRPEDRAVASIPCRIRTDGLQYHRAEASVIVNRSNGYEEAA